MLDKIVLIELMSKFDCMRGNEYGRAIDIKPKSFLIYSPYRTSILTYRQNQDVRDIRRNDSNTYMTTIIPKDDYYEIHTEKRKEEPTSHEDMKPKTKNNYIEHKCYLKCIQLTNEVFESDQWHIKIDQLYKILGK